MSEQRSAVKAGNEILRRNLPGEYKTEKGCCDESSDARHGAVEPGRNPDPIGVDRSHDAGGERSN